MPKPSEIISTVASLMNDTAQSVYTDTACLPYLNLAMRILQEEFELNDIPVTHKTSAAITVPTGYTKIGFDTTPALPSNLIEIEELWESTSGQNQWIPVVRKDFLPHYLEGQTISQFLIWAWNGAIELLPANTINDLKLDYLASLFINPIKIANIDVDIPLVNVQTTLEFKTASLCALFIAENESRAIALNGEANEALGRSLGIPIKGMQTVITRRRPFRSSFKRRGISY